MSISKFDYIIIGAGAAGLNLALRMQKESYFDTKQILIVDKEAKNTDDRTWSFWEKGPSKLDKIVTKQWLSGVFFSPEKKYELNIYPYIYKTIRSSKFYTYARNELSKSNHISWVKDEIKKVIGNKVIGSKGTYEAGHIFDSRIPNAFEKEKETYSSLVQHFKGWFIKTKKASFNPDQFVMMDYRIMHEDQTSFMYVLPFSEDYALVEYTFFNTYFVEDDVYEQKIKRYLSDFLQVRDYDILEIEKGSIPMSDYPFHQHHSKHCTLIGTAGGWVRPSSGYSFKNAQRFSKAVVNNIKTGKLPSDGVAKGRFRKYDSIFLEVLKQKNQFGPKIFETIYTKNDLVTVFRFLDEKSSLIEDYKIMNSLNYPEFRKALAKKIIRKD